MTQKNRSKLIAGALLKGGLDADDRIHAELFSAAFEELDGLSDKLSRIPDAVDASANRFQKITTQAVDDFVYVANEALSKFMQRTNEIKTALEAIEQAKTVVVAKAVATPPTAAPKAAVKNNVPLWWIIPISAFIGIALGSTLTYFVLK